MGVAPKTYRFPPRLTGDLEDPLEISHEKSLQGAAPSLAKLLDVGLRLTSGVLKSPDTFQVWKCFPHISIHQHPSNHEKELAPLQLCSPGAAGAHGFPGRSENLGLGILPGWPLADLRAALRHRSRTCTAPWRTARTWTDADV